MKNQIRDWKARAGEVGSADMWSMGRNAESGDQ